MEFNVCKESSLHSMTEVKQHVHLFPNHALQAHFGWDIYDQDFPQF